MVRSTLYKCPGAWSLPSAAPTSIQVEAYLRLCGADYEARACTSNSQSPTGQLPAVEHDPDVSAGAATGPAAARACIAFAKKAIKDLDAHLTAGQRAELLAFSALIEHKLDAATEYSTWCEKNGYSEYAKAAFQGQPFPLNYIIPWSTRRDMQAKYAHADSEQLYHEACDALTAFNDKLRSSEGRYVLGIKPSSLDALLIGHLLFYHSSPAAAPVLHSKVEGLPELTKYIEYMHRTLFPATDSTPVSGSSSSSSSRAGPTSRSKTTGTEEGSSAAGDQQESSWSEAAKGNRRPSKPAELTEAEREFRRKSWWWLSGAAALTVGYILFSGQYIQVHEMFQGGDMDDDDDDHDDDAGGDDE